MEFDLNSFMFEVTNALQYDTPQFRAPDARDDINPDVLERRAGNQEASHSKRRRLYPSNATLTRGGSRRSRPPMWDDFITSDLGSESSDCIPAFFHPSLDMTTAIISSHPNIPPRVSIASLDLAEHGTNSSDLLSTERLDLVPTFYSYSVKACLLPIRQIQNQLVAHYFNYIHPMFPVVDEYHLTEIHQNFAGKEEIMDKADFMVYYAIMVAGFAHLSEEDLSKTPYRSVIEGQEAQVEQLKARYWSLQTSDPIILTQVCLILSLWSPGWVGFQNNSYWIDMAFKHATDAKLSEPYSAEKVSIRRCRVLWWCCVVRDRVLAFGMRRPHRLHETSIKDTFITEDDFGLEAKFPSYTNIRMKRVTILAFMWLCRMSLIMEKLAIIQRRTKFARDWDGDEAENIIPALEELNRVHQQLKAWIKEFETEIAEAMENETGNEVPIPVSILRIVANSLRATLYQPYLNLAEDHPALLKTAINPLKLIKDGAREVAKSVSSVMAHKKSDAIPTWLVSWITLPVAVYHVNQRIQLNSTPDQVLMPFLAQLVRRTSGALMLLLTVRSATKDHIGDIVEEITSNTGFSFVHSGLSPPVPRRKEAELLAFVARAIDDALERNGRVEATELKMSA